MNGFGVEIKEKNCYDNLGLNEFILVKRTLQRWVGLQLPVPGQKEATGFIKHGNKSLGFKNSGNFLNIFLILEHQKGPAPGFGLILMSVDAVQEFMTQLIHVSAVLILRDMHNSDYFS